MRNICLLFRRYPVCSTWLKQPELRKGTVVGTGRTVRAHLVSILVRDDKDLASVLVLESSRGDNG